MKAKYEKKPTDFDGMRVSFFNVLFMTATKKKNRMTGKVETKSTIKYIAREVEKADYANIRLNYFFAGKMFENGLKGERVEISWELEFSPRTFPFRFHYFSQNVNILS